MAYRSPHRGHTFTELLFGFHKRQPMRGCKDFLRHPTRKRQRPHLVRASCGVFLADRREMIRIEALCQADDSRPEPSVYVGDLAVN